MVERMDPFHFLAGCCKRSLYGLSFYYYYYYYYKNTDYSDASLKLQGHFTYQIKKNKEKTMVQ